jgi:hypothetical protein
VQTTEDVEFFFIIDARCHTAIAEVSAQFQSAPSCAPRVEQPHVVHQRHVFEAHPVSQLGAVLAADEGEVVLAQPHQHVP